MINNVVIWSFPVASPETLVTTVDPDRVDISEEEGGEPPNHAGVLFRHSKGPRLSEFRVYLHLNDLPCRRPEGQLYV